MAVPVIELISQNIETVLNTISAVTVIRTTRVDFDDVTPADSHVLLTLDNIDHLNGGEGASNVNSYNATFNLAGFIFDVAGGSDPIDQRIGILTSDIIKQLNLDTTRGGYAIRTFVSSVEYIHDQQLNGGLMTVVVYYRTAYGDPYTAA